MNTTIIMTLSFEKDPKFTCGCRHWKGCELQVFVKCWKQSDLKSTGKLYQPVWMGMVPSTGGELR